MAADLSFLFNGTPPQAVTGSTTSTANVPDWLSDYRRGIAGKATAIAGNGYQAYPDARLADFNGDQQNAFQSVRNNQGDWKPELGAAQQTAASIAPNADARLAQGAQYGAGALGSVTGAAGAANDIAGSAAGAANGAVAGPAQTFTNNYQQYMSPYTANVVNEIGRLGNQNLQENLIPGVQDQFLGNGQFGSTRNADILGRTVRDAQTNISGLQSNALQAGYNTAGTLFNQDANRAQQQGQLQATTALNAGQLGTQTALGGGSMVGQTALGAGTLANNGASIGAYADTAQAAQQGALATMQQTLGNNDAQNLANVGSAQQGLTQAGLNTSYQDFLNQRDNDKNNLTWMNSMVNGLPVNTSSTQITNNPATNANTFGASPAASGMGALSQI